MRLIYYYVACMIAGNFVAYFIGLFVEYEWGSYASLMVLGGLDICGVDDRTKEGRSGCGHIGSLSAYPRIALNSHCFAPLLWSERLFGG